MDSDPQTDLQRPGFTVAMRGYSRDEVDRFVGELNRRLGAALAERDELAQELEDARRELEDAEDGLDELKRLRREYGDRVRALETLIAAAAREVAERGAFQVPQEPEAEPPRAAPVPPPAAPEPREAEPTPDAAEEPMEAAEEPEEAEAFEVSQPEPDAFEVSQPDRDVAPPGELAATEQEPTVTFDIDRAADDEIEFEPAEAEDTDPGLRPVRPPDASEPDGPPAPEPERGSWEPPDRDADRA